MRGEGARRVKLPLVVEEEVQLAPRIALTAVGCEVIVHMVELEFGAE